jgi:hypothetical protein
MLMTLWLMMTSGQDPERRRSCEIYAGTAALVGIHVANWQQSYKQLLPRMLCGATNGIIAR